MAGNMFTICLEVYHGNWIAINWGDSYSQECFIAGFWVSWGSTVFTWRVHSDIFDAPSTWSCPLIPLNLPNKQVEFDIPEVECTKNALGNQWVIVSSWRWGCWSVPMRALDPIWGLCSSDRTGIMMAWSAKVKPFSWLSVQEGAYWTKLMPQSQPFANCLWKTSDANDVRAMSFVSHDPFGIGYVCAVPARASQKT